MLFLECTEGTFKQSAGDAMCMSCPLNSDSSGVSPRTQCNCLEGHERADPVDVTLPCSSKCTVYLTGSCQMTYAVQVSSQLQYCVLHCCTHNILVCSI